MQRRGADRTPHLPPASRPRIPPWLCSNPNTAPASSAWQSRDPRRLRAPHSPQALSRACGRGANDAQDVGSGPGLGLGVGGDGSGGIAAPLSGGGRGSPPSMLPFELRPGTGSNHRLLTRDQSSPERSCSSAVPRGRCPCTGWGLSRRRGVRPLLPDLPVVALCLLAVATSTAWCGVAWRGMAQRGTAWHGTV